MLTGSNPLQAELDERLLVERAGVEPRLVSTLRSNGRLVVGGTIVGLAVFCALAAPWIAPHDPSAQNLADSLMPPAWSTGGSGTHLLGTDYLGRDVLSRIIYGARVSLIISSGGVALALLVGSLLGLFGGYVGRSADTIIMRVADVQLSIPFLLLVVVLAGILGPSYWSVIVVFGFAVWPIFARIMRSEVLRLRHAGFVEAGQVLGAGTVHNLRKHVLPNAAGTLATVASFQMASMIIYEAGLGFLGLSVPPTVPSWGNMLSDGEVYLTSAWWLAVFPGLAVFIVCLGINFLGDWMRDHVDRRKS